MEESLKKILVNSSDEYIEFVRLILSDSEYQKDKFKDTINYYLNESFNNDYYKHITPSKKQLIDDLLLIIG